MPPYQIIKIDQSVGVGVTGAYWATVRALLKENSRDDPYCVANELICGQLAQFIGLPVPPCGLFVEPRNRARLYFGTLNFNLSGDSLPPADERVRARLRGSHESAASGPCDRYADVRYLGCER